MRRALFTDDDRGMEECVARAIVGSILWVIWRLLSRSLSFLNSQEFPGGLPKMGHNVLRKFIFK